MNPLLKFISLSLLTTSFFGCSTYTKQSAKIAEAWKAGDGVLAASLISNKVAKVEGEKDDLIWNLEYGTILLAVGNVEKSIDVFDYAESVIDDYEEQAKVSLGKEAGALLTNQASLPYRGRSYDKILVNTYKALQYLRLDQDDKARVELNRSLQRQKDAVALNSKKISKAEEAAAEAKSGELAGEGDEKEPEYDVDRASQDPQFAAAVAGEMSAIDERMLPYADYVNPFAVFLDGLYFSILGQGNSDFDRARKSFERVQSMSKGTYISEDYKMAENQCAGTPPGALTYVLFMTGSAPSRDQIRIDIPLFLVTSEVAYVGASFPKLVYHDDYLPEIGASSSNGTYYTSELLCSMDAVISKDFKNEWPIVLTKTLLSTATKALAARALQEVADQSGSIWVQLGTKVATVGYQVGANIADTRTWRTLPKQYSYIRMPSPEEGKIELTLGARKFPVEVAPDKTNIIMVRSVTPLSEPIITQFSVN